MPILASISSKNYSRSPIALKTATRPSANGFIAQDLEQALPVPLQDIIERSEPEHGLALIERQRDKDRTYRVSYGELTAPVVKAIRQMQHEIEAERQENADLRHALATMGDQVAALKAQNDNLHHSIEVVEGLTASR
jgi:hypothetical protein